MASTSTARLSPGRPGTAAGASSDSSADPGPAAEDQGKNGKNGKSGKSGKKGGKRKKLLIILPLVLVLAFAAKTMLGGSAKGAAAETPKPGPIVALDPVTLNLAGGHYLRIGISVEFTDKVSPEEPPSAALATDQVIVYFTGQDAGPLQTPQGLDDAKKALKDKIASAYPDDPVYDIFFTSFVVQ